MGPRDWRYSRKTPGRYNAIGGFRMWREPLADVDKPGRVISETERSWLVHLDEDPPRTRRQVSKKYARREPDLEGREDRGMFHIPGWLWAKMNEGER